MNRKKLVVTLGVATLSLFILVPMVSAAPIMLEDFDPAPTDLTTTTGQLDLYYKNIIGQGSEPGWAAGRTNRFTYSGQLTNTDNSQTTVTGAVFSVDLSEAATGWQIELDVLSGEAGAGIVWFGKDDGDNQPDDLLMDCGNSVRTDRQDRNVQNAIVDGEWLVYDLQLWRYADPADQPAHVVYDITGLDTTGFDLVAVVIQANAGKPFVNVDNIQLTQIPEPCSLLLAGMGFLGLVFFGRRRRS